CSTNHGIPLEFSSAFSMVHRLHTKCRLTPACNDAAAVAAGRALHSTASRSSETVLPPAASEYAPHRACPSSAAARSWHESAPHRPPTTRGPTRPANPPASDSCRWLPCRSAPAPLLAGRTVPRRPRPVPASAPRSLPSPYPTNSLVASWDENHIL